MGVEFPFGVVKMFSNQTEMVAAQFCDCAEGYWIVHLDFMPCAFHLNWKKNEGEIKTFLDQTKKKLRDILARRPALQENLRVLEIRKIIKVRTSALHRVKEKHQMLYYF